MSGYSVQKIREAAKNIRENVYSILLEDIEIYRCIKNDENYILIIEGGLFPMAYLFNLVTLVNVIPLRSGSEQGAKEAGRELSVTLRGRLPILEKLRNLLIPTCLIIIVRHKELTRGGEYIELTFLLDRGAQPQKIKFLWNKDIPMSTMIKELLAAYGFAIHSYTDEEEMKDEVHSLIYYNCIPNTKQDRKLEKKMPKKEM